MHRSNGSLLRKLGILAAMIALALTAVSCSSDDPVSVPNDILVDNQAPGAPTIDTAAGTPTDGAVDVSTTVTLHWSCTDADGDVLTYTLHWGNTETPPELSADQTETSYGPIFMVNETTFYWQIVATDPDGETTASPVWSFTTVAPDVETVSVPNTPTGPTTGEIGESLLFNTTGAVSSQGHTVEYQFSWDDGGDSDFMDGVDAAHSWDAVGTYEVAARARCVTYPEIESAWSGTITVTITEPEVETIGTPDALSGPTTGETTESLTYSTSVVTSSLGHPVAYVFDWGDGTETTTSLTQSSHTWPEAGIYDIRVKAHCVEHPEIESAWSPTTQVTITVPGETISTPCMRSNITDLTGVGEEEWVSCHAATSNLGHPLEYRFDVENDGTYTVWSTNRNYYHTWLTAGTYTLRAQARCAEHTDILSDWTTDTYAHEIVVNDGAETISTPIILTEGPVEYPVDESNSYLASAVSSLGHYLEYQFDWGNGETSTWGSECQYYAYPAVGTFEVRAKARCCEHTDIESAWSEALIVNVVGSITQPTISGPTTGVVGNPITFTTPGSTSSEGHDLEYRLYISHQYFWLGTPQEWTTIDNLTYTFPSARTWYVRVQARSITDQGESDPSMYHIITISAE